MTYGDFNDLTGRTASEIILLDKTFNITNNPKYDGYQRGLPSMFYKFFDKNTSATRARSETLATQINFLVQSWAKYIRQTLVFM